MTNTKKPVDPLDQWLKPVDASTAPLNPSYESTEQETIPTTQTTQLNPKQTSKNLIPEPVFNTTSPTSEQNTPLSKEWAPPQQEDAERTLWSKAWDKSPKWLQQTLLSLGAIPPLESTFFKVLTQNMTHKGALIIGPTSTGKTTFVAAIQRACLMPSNGEVDLHWRSAGSPNSQADLAELLDNALAQILDNENARPTGKHVQYNFFVEGRKHLPHTFNGAQLFDLQFSFHDGPGGALFTDNVNAWNDQAATRNTIIQHAKNAYTLMLCFDGSIRNAKSVQKNLGRILPLLQHAQINDGYYITPMKVIIILNKIDQACFNVYKKAEQNDFSIQDTNITPKSLAEHLDIFAMAVECIGFESIKLLRSVMRPDAELTIATTSAWGFQHSGHPLVNAHGAPNLHSQIEKGHDNDFLEQWHPFGVHDILLYLSLGIESPYLHKVTPQDLRFPLVEPCPIEI